MTAVVSVVVLGMPLPNCLRPAASSTAEAGRHDGTWRPSALNIRCSSDAMDAVAVAGARTVSGPLLQLTVGFRGKVLRGNGTSGQAAALRWSGRRCAPTALRGSVSWPRRRTRFAHCVRCAETAATSQSTARAAREATSPVLLGTPEARPSLPERAFAEALVLRAAKNTILAARQAVPGEGDFCGGEERRPSVGARRALRELTRRSYLSAESEANAASSATRLKVEHRSGVGASLRPPQHEPSAGTAGCVAPMRSESSHLRMTAPGRQRPPAEHVHGAAEWNI